MSLQYIFNISNQIKIDRRKLVGVQYSRSQIPKSELTPTKNPWRLSVTAPNQSYWDVKAVLEQLDTIDRYLPETIQLGGNANINWMFAYRGVMSSVNVQNLVVLSFIGNQLVLGNLPSTTADRCLFEIGDMIQIDNHYFPFTSQTRVLRGSGSTVTVITHRPNIITSDVVGSGIVVGSDCRMQVFCPNMPTYTLTPGARLVRNGVLLNNAIVQWDSDFQLYEWVGNS